MGFFFVFFGLFIVFLRKSQKVSKLQSINPEKRILGCRMTNCPSLPKAVWLLVLKVSHPRKYLSPGQTGQLGCAKPEAKG